MYINSQKGGVGLWLLVISVVAAGAFFWYRSRGVDTPPESNAVAPTEAPVVYDAKGFSPNTVTIKNGSTVTFQNKTGKRASVASDDHPTHTKYAAFDQYKTDQRGLDEFRFTFEQAGSWLPRPLERQ